MAGGHKRATFKENVFVPMASNDNLPALRANTRPSVDTAPSDLVNQEVGTNTADSRAPPAGASLGLLPVAVFLLGRFLFVSCSVQAASWPQRGTVTAKGLCCSACAAVHVGAGIARRHPLRVLLFPRRAP